MSANARAKRVARAIVSCAALCAAAGAARAQDFPKTVNLYVGYGSGGGYDTNARLVARHWGRFLPGSPSIVVQNMPGAGGLRLANWIYSVAPSDGSAVAITGTPNFLSPLLGGKGAQFDPLKLTYLGSLSSESTACGVWHTAGVKTLDDLRHKEVTAAASGPSSVSTVYPLALNAVLGTKLKLVQGYTGSAQSLMAIERGEVQAFCGWTHLAHPEWITEKKAYLFTQIGLKADPRFKGVPLALDFAKTEDDRRVLELIFAPQQITRPYVAPPGLPAARTKALRDGLAKLTEDAGYRKDAAKLQLEPDYLSGEEVTALIRKLYASPEPVVTRAKSILNP